jgi:hypothetical protein
MTVPRSLEAIGRKCTIVARFRPHASGELTADLENGSFS